MNLPSFDWMISAEFWAMAAVVMIFIIGFVATLLPVAPGNLIVLGGVIMHRLWVPQCSVSWNIIGMMTALTLLALLGDYALTWWGAKRYGATWRGSLGAVLGAILAVFIPPQFISLLVAPWVGAVLFELIGGRNFPDSSRAGWGSFIGSMLATAFKIAVSTAIIIGFLLARTSVIPEAQELILP